MIVFTISIAIYSWYYFISKPVLKPQLVFSRVDKFGIKEIYPTTPNGSEWFINMQNPLKDSLFSITNNLPIKKNNQDSSWVINGTNIRMNVNTPKGFPQWKNIEMTGYVKVTSISNETILSNSTDNDNNDNNSKVNNNTIVDIDWRARGGEHTNKAPCEGTALNGGIYIDGTVAWKKEIWFTGGYTDARGVNKDTDSIEDRWIGWKVVMYNIDNNKAVKMESYLDDKNNNDWKKVSDLIDNEGWFAKSNDSVFYSAGCGKPKDYVITNAGPIATFRADNAELSFKDLSIREIQA